MNMVWYVYIAEFAKGNLYTGITTDVTRRIREHNDGIGAKSLRGKGPIKLLYFKKQSNKIIASRREKEIKGLTRSKKLNFLKGLP